MKTVLESKQLSSRKGSRETGPAALWYLFMGFFLGICLTAVVAAGLKFSQEPRSAGPISRDDLEIFDHDNGNGTYTTLTQTNSLLRYGSIDWGGPSNALSMTNQEYYFAANSDCAITGLVNKASMTNTAIPVVLTIDNTNTSGVITARWPANISTVDGIDELPITNGCEGIISLRLNRRAQQTNIVARMFFN